MLEIFNGRSKFYQWDVGQKLIVDDGIIAVQYDNGTGDALVCPVYEYEGQLVADVPNIMLQTYFPIKAYAYCGECVRAERVIEVEKRSRPDDYIYTETETLRYTTLFEMLTDLEAKHNADKEALEQGIAATGANLAEVSSNLNKLAADNEAAFNSLETTIETLDEKHITDNDAINIRLAKHDSDIAANAATLKQHKEGISTNTNKIYQLETNLDIQVDNIYSINNEQGRKIQENEKALTAIEEDLEELAATHAADYNRLNNSLSFTSTVSNENRQRIIQCESNINIAEESIDTLSTNVYKHINEQNTTLSNHESRIETLENRPTGGGGGGGTASDVDWNENNPDSPAYIKNRTHYEQITEGFILPETVIEIIPEEATGLITTPISFDVGQTYTVNWNGAEYNTTAFEMEGVCAIGNAALAGIPDAQPTEEPFVIAIAPPEYVAVLGAYAMVMAIDGSEQVVLSISGVMRDIHKLDNKFLDLSNYYTIDETRQLVVEALTTKNNDNSYLLYSTVDISNKATTGEVEVYGAKKLYASVCIRNPREVNGLEVTVYDKDNHFITSAKNKSAIRVTDTLLIYDIFVYVDGNNMSIIDIVERDYYNEFKPIMRYVNPIVNNEFKNFGTIEIKSYNTSPIKSDDAKVYIYGVSM